MEKTTEREQTFGQKLVLCVIAGTMFLTGLIFVEVEVEGGGVWLHTIGMLLTLSSILFADEIKGKRAFLRCLKNHWKSIVKIFFPN